MPQKNSSIAHTALPKRRLTKSQRTGCAFRIAVKLQRGDSWALERIRSHKSHVHNHPKAEVLGYYAKYRAELLKALDEALRIQFRAGDRASKALGSLREEYDDAKHITKRDILNRFYRYRREECQGLSPIALLLRICFQYTSLLHEVPLYMPCLTLYSALAKGRMVLVVSLNHTDKIKETTGKYSPFPLSAHIPS